MKKKEINQILELNNKFYHSIAKDFSKTRQKPWEGWGRVIEIIKREFDDANVKILDLGCGNGRFFNLLCEKLNDFEYVGVDINNDLLSEGKQIQTRHKNQSGKFIKEDIFKSIDKIPGKYDVITAFGVTHHIPDENFRKKWLLTLPNLLNKVGKTPSLLVLTFWDFEKKPGDYFLGWGNDSEVSRFCHKFSKKELEDIEKEYKKIGLKLIEKYNADKNNYYMIFGRI